MKCFHSYLAILTICIFASFSSKSQDQTAETVKALIESQNFVFKAETASPQGGSSRQLSPMYDLTVTRNSVIAYLPYFGRAYTAPIDATDGGIKFNSSLFDYKATKNKNVWDISIKPKDVNNVSQLYLVVYDNGRATLQVMNISRQDISFNGYIK